MDSTKEKVYQAMNTELKKILQWSESASPKWDSQNFDIDDTLHRVQTDFNVKYEYGILSTIYGLVDALCDAILHQFSEVSKGYSVDEAITDLRYVIDKIDKGEIDQLEADEQFLKKVSTIWL